MRYAGVSGELTVIDTLEYGLVVVKRALPRLRTQAEWRSDPSRSLVEARCLQRLAEILDPGSVPRVLWVDEANYSFGMEKLPDLLVPWKARLLDGDVDLNTAYRVGALLGQLHRRTLNRVDLAREFDERRFLSELRIAPFHNRIALRHPDLADQIHQVVADMLLDRRCLVHGDYSPKNLLTDNARVVLLDCEVAHWGDPRFDVGFCLAHLLLKTVRGPHAADLAAAARAFLDAYAVSGLDVLDSRLSQATACVVIARIDGDSPVDYLDAPRRRNAVALGRRLLLEAPADPAEGVAWALELA